MNMRTLLEKTTTELRSRNSFKFYVPTVLGNQQISAEEEVRYSAPTPDLHRGEIIIQEAHRVVLFFNPLDRKKGIVGDLFVTNFRFFLVPTQQIETIIHKQVNLLTGEFGICLTNVDSLYQISGNKSRKLSPYSTIDTRIKCLRIVCKNMRALMLGFEESPFDHGKQIAQTLLHHAFPGRHSLLFAYDYGEPVDKSEGDHGVPLYTSHKDWATEVKRTCREHEDRWRISAVNNDFAVSLYLPQWLVVPKSLVDIDLTEMARAFCYSRPPTWSWSHPCGAAVIRMANCLPTITVRTQENRFMETLRAMHPNKKAPVMMELDKSLPSIRDIQLGYQKLREICIPESRRAFESQESKFHALLENSKWMHSVSSCLREAHNAAEQIVSGVTVVLQEDSGRDTSAVIASLVQVMLDPVYRRTRGFQALIQKEWVAMGHPFSSRLGHVRDSGQEQSAVFFLFLNCVWQLQNQFTTFFQFNETYLTTLLDSCHISLFDTFLFDNERQRGQAKGEDSKLQLRSVWNWHKQFKESSIQQFTNPLYQIDDLICPQSPKMSHSRIKPLFEVYHLDLWEQCYFRWLPSLSIRLGGRPRVDLIHTHLRKHIDALFAELVTMTKKTQTELLMNRSELSLSPLRPISDSLADISLDDFCIDNSFPFSGCEIDTPTSLADCSMYSEYDTQSVLNLTD